jgi:hypothetical protein
VTTAANLRDQRGAVLRGTLYVPVALTGPLSIPAWYTAGVLAEEHVAVVDDTTYSDHRTIRSGKWADMDA